MKKRVLLFLTAILLFATCSMSFIPASANETATATDSEAVSDELQALEETSLQKYNLLLRTWAYDPEYIDDVYADFPSFYGGAYINDAKELVIQVTSLDTETTAYFENLIDLTNVVFEVVDYPYSRLIEEHDAIVETLSSSTDYSLNSSVAAVGIAMQDNSVALYVISPDTEISTASLDDVQTSLSDFENIKIIETTGSATTTGSAATTGSATTTTKTPVKPGSLISNRSVGFWAEDSSGNLGIVTAPHNTISKGATIKIGTESFGTASTPYFSGSVDAVFIKCTSTKFTPSREVHNASFSLVSDSYTVLSVGSSTYSSGKESGCESGEVTDIHYTVYYNYLSPSVTLTGCVLTNATCTSGDSGGVVAGGGGSTLKYVAGIITGADPNDKQVYVKMANIKSKLGVTVY